METYLQQEKLLETEIEQRANATFEHQKMRTAARTKLEQSKVVSAIFLLADCLVGNRWHDPEKRRPKN